MEDTLQVMVRSLHERTVRFEVVDQDIVREYVPAEPYRLEWAVDLATEPPIRGRVSIAMTVDLGQGVAHFVAQAVLREATA